MVTFNGSTKIITLNNGITNISAIDIYSLWKEWVLESDNSKYLPAFRAIGGEETTPGVFLSSTYFLLNGWKIRPYEGSHTLVVSGNIFADDGSDVFISTIGSYNVRINLNTSNIVSTIAVGSGVTAQDKTDIISGVQTNLNPKLDNILGLLHHNFKFYEQTYNSDGNLTGGIIKIYPSNTDCVNDTNEISTYSVSAVYDSNKKLIDYSVVTL